MQASSTVNNWCELLDERDVGILFTHYAREMPARIERLNTAVCNSDYPQIKRLAHQLRGSALQYGFTELGSLATSLEVLAALSAPICEIERIRDEVIVLCRQARSFIQHHFGEAT